MRRLLAILGLGATLVATAAVAAPPPAHQAALDRTVRYLQGAQNPDGGFGGTPGAESSQLFSAWVALALAAAGVNPQDQKLPGGSDVFSYLASHYEQGVEESDCAPVACTTTLERELMVVNAAGASPHDFGGRDLVRELLDRAGADGSFPHEPGGAAGVNDTAFAIFALAPIDEPAAQAPIEAAADWVEAAQHRSGGWYWNTASEEDEVDMTGAAIQALLAAGRGRNAAVLAGLDYLRRAQGADGGFPDLAGKPESNVASTAWAVQAIWAAGENPEEWRTAAGTEPLGYLESLQEPDGHIRWKSSQDLNGVWMTAYVAPAFAGQAWPFPAPPRSADSGGAEGAGVIAGGGGSGAPLFSRPKPRSRGRTPGGARVLRSRDPIDHSRSRRGANRVQASGTAASEAGAVALATGRVGDGRGATASTRAEAERRGEGELPGPGQTRASDGAVVSGIPVGEEPGTAFGAPGLRSGGFEQRGPWTALAIGAAAALLALLGARLEWRSRLLLPGAGG